MIDTGVTSDLACRVAERGGAFTKRYSAHCLVYCAEHADVNDAIALEETLNS